MHTTRAKRSLDEGQDELDAKLELLSQLCLQDVTADAHTRRPSRFDDEWIEAEFGWARPARQDLRVFDDEEDGDACTAHLYDPTLFADPRSTHARASSALLSPDHRAYSNKPLPDLPRPSLVRLGVPDAPPSSPLLTAFAPPPPRAGFAPAATPESTPPASPAHSTFLPSLTPPASPAAPAFLAPAETAEPPPPPPPKNKAHTFPRATPPDARGAPQRHGTYPSISSTLELLVERATPREKRSGVYVPDTDDETATQDSHAAPRMSAAGRMRSASEAVLPLAAAAPPRRRVRPVLPALATSTSSPSLREIAFSSSSSSSSSSGTMIALTPASATQHDAPQPFPSAEDERQPPSRWSLDSVRPPHAQDSFHPLGARAPASSASLAPTPTPTPTTTRRRDRLISFITRGRSGSLAKPAGDGARRSGSKDALRPSSRDAARRSRASLSAGSAAPPLPLPLPLPHAPGMGAMARSASAGSSSASSSASSLPTPAETLADPFSPTSDSFVPACAEGVGDESDGSEGASPPPAPTLPLPSPGTPSPSLLAPARPSSLFAALALKRRRKKKLVIAGVLAGAGAGAGAAEQERRYENVMRWCRGFGETRKIEWKEDGSLHVYWKEWEVADRVCRVQAQVYIKDVGRVSLAWHYTS